MKEAIAELVETLKNDSRHFLAVCGNIFDAIPFNESKDHKDVLDFLIELSSKKFPLMISYDLFSGIQVLRGKVENVIKLIGLKVGKKQDDDELMKMINDANPRNTDPLRMGPQEAFLCFSHLWKANEKTLLVIKYPESLTARTANFTNDQATQFFSIALQEWSRNEEIHKQGHLIVLLGKHADEIDKEILDRCGCLSLIRFNKPDIEERQERIQSLGIAQKHLQTIANVTAGLSFQEINRILKPVSKDVGIESLLQTIFTEKRKALRDEYGDLLEIMETRNGFEAIGGLEKPIAKFKLIAKAMKEGKTSLVPQGVLLMGPPGTGKTIIAEAFAKEARLNFIKPRDIKSMWVGESERRMSRFLQAIKDLAPVAVFIDEFDQNQGQRGGFDGDSGVSRGLFKKMLEIMSDTTLRGKILWLMATNRPDLIDLAMKRPGRCDLRIPFLPPDDKQLVLICQAALNQYPEIQSAIQDWTPYVLRCRGYNGADMIEVIRRAWERANELEREVIIDEDMKWACDDYRPQTCDAVSIARMTLIALLECSSKSLLPNNDDLKNIIRNCVDILTGLPSQSQLEIDKPLLKNTKFYLN